MFFTDKKGNVFIWVLPFVVCPLLVASSVLVVSSYVFKLLPILAVVLKIAAVISAALWVYEFEPILAALSAFSATQFIFLAYRGEEIVEGWSEVFIAANPSGAFGEIFWYAVALVVYLILLFANGIFYVSFNVGDGRLGAGGEVLGHVLYGGIGWALSLALVLLPGVL